MKKIEIWGRVLVNLFRGYNDIGMGKKIVNSLDGMLYMF